MSDNWAHRSAGMQCRTCMWFAPKVLPNGEPAETHEVGATTSGLVERVGFGRCRRRAPTMSGFPAVFGSDWCGDHKLDETQI